MESNREKNNIDIAIFEKLPLITRVTNIISHFVVAIIFSSTVMTFKIIDYFVI